MIMVNEKGFPAIPKKEGHGVVPSLTGFNISFQSLKKSKI